MRAFYGIVLDKETKNKLYEIQKKVSKISNKGRFVSEENFHITLKFLGDIGSNEVDDYIDLLEAGVSGFNAFVLKAEGIGSFSKGNKLIPWVGLKSNKALIAMNKNLQDILFRNYGIRYENYTPHLTLGREVVTSEDINSLSITPFDIVVNKIALFESKNINNKLVYQEKAIITLH